jgi:hypothetical protein
MRSDRASRADPFWRRRVLAIEDVFIRVPVGLDRRPLHIAVGRRALQPPPVHAQTFAATVMIADVNAVDATTGATLLSVPNALG